MESDDNLSPLISNSTSPKMNQKKKNTEAAASFLEDMIKNFIALCKSDNNQGSSTINNDTINEDNPVVNKPHISELFSLINQHRIHLKYL